MSTKQKKKNKGGGIKERNPYKLRNGHKAYATKLISETKELLNESSPEVREKLKILTISLNEILQKIADLDEEILDQVDSEEEIAEEIETAGSFRAGMHDVVVKIDDLLISRSQRPPAKKRHKRRKGRKYKTTKIRAQEVQSRSQRVDNLLGAF